MITPIATFEFDKPAWLVDARCNDGAGSLVDIFFSEDLGDIARAKAICARCAVTDECFDDARRRREPWGVWGGQLFVNGRVILSKRRRGRPPKVARPDFVIDELGYATEAIA